MNQTFSGILPCAKFLLTRLRVRLWDERGDAKFDSAIQIVIAFVIGGLILTLLGTVFGTTIKTWLNTTAGSWFSGTGVPKPSV